MNRTIALAGLGTAARQIHLPACSAIPGLEVVGGFDPVVQESFPFPLFDSLEEMLARVRPDILAIASPPAFHFELARAGLRAGCHVFCEKPFTTDLDQALQLLDLARTVSRHVVVNNQYRFMNTHRAARELIGTPDFGELLFLSASQTFRITSQTEAGWRSQERRRTCLEFGTHILDLCRYFFDEDPLALTARMPGGKNANGPDLLNLIQLEFSGDRLAHITLDRLCRGPHRYLSLRLDGSIGCIETHLGGRAEFAVGLAPRTWKPYFRLDLSPGGQAHLHQGNRSRKIATEPLNVFARATRRLLDAFLHALDEGTVPPCDAEDNVKTLALMLAAYESAETGKSVDRPCEIPVASQGTGVWR